MIKKYKKYHVFKKKTKYANNKLNFGDYGLISLNHGYLNLKQIETGRRTITSSLERKGRIWIRALADFPYTKKPNETRMGKGKGNVDHWLSNVYPGQIIYEVSSKDNSKTIYALIKAAKKMPFNTRIIKK